MGLVWYPTARGFLGAAARLFDDCS